MSAKGVPRSARPRCLHRPAKALRSIQSHPSNCAVARDHHDHGPRGAGPGPTILRTPFHGRETVPSQGQGLEEITVSNQLVGFLASFSDSTATAPEAESDGFSASGPRLREPSTKNEPSDRSEPNMTREPSRISEPIGARDRQANAWNANRPGWSRAERLARRRTSRPGGAVP